MRRFQNRRRRREESLTSLIKTPMRVGGYEVLKARHIKRNLETPHVVSYEVLSQHL